MSGDEVLNPVTIENEIAKLRNRIASGVSVISNAEVRAKAARRAFDKQFAIAITTAEGTQQDKKYQAVLATMDLREKAEDAEAEFHHAERTAFSLKDELSALQTISKSVVAMYESVRR